MVQQIFIISKSMYFNINQQSTIVSLDLRSFYYPMTPLYLPITLYRIKNDLIQNFNRDSSNKITMIYEPIVKMIMSSAVPRLVLEKKNELAARTVLRRYYTDKRVNS